MSPSSKESAGNLCERLVPVPDSTADAMLGGGVEKQGVYREGLGGKGSQKSVLSVYVIERGRRSASRDRESPTCAQKRRCSLEEQTADDSQVS